MYPSSKKEILRSILIYRVSTNVKLISIKVRTFLLSFVVTIKAIFSPIRSVSVFPIFPSLSSHSPTLSKMYQIEVVYVLSSLYFEQSLLFFHLKLSPMMCVMEQLLVKVILSLFLSGMNEFFLLYLFV